MESEHPTGNRLPAYGSARDLPSYKELSDQIRGAKLLTRFIVRSQRKQLLEIEGQLERLVRVVDDFYERLGSRNWVFHDLLNVDEIERLLLETTDAETGEKRLIELYQHELASTWWITGLSAHDGLRQRVRQIERAFEHYDTRQYDSCVLQLIAVMDGFVNDFKPSERRGLHARDADEMAAWDSVVGHHMGLTHAMKTFTTPKKKRVDDEVFEVYRHGIMHGSIVNFDNVVVATKAWNMLFAVADWATATSKSSIRKDPPPSWRDTWAAVVRNAEYKRSEREFAPSTILASDPSFAADEMVVLASEFLDAWEHGRWGIVAKFTPPMLREFKSDGEAARDARDTFEQYRLDNWSIECVTRDQTSSAAVSAEASVNGEHTKFQFRMAYWGSDGNVGVPIQDEGAWSVAVWAPRAYFDDAA